MIFLVSVLALIGSFCNADRQLQSQLQYFDVPELLWQRQTGVILNGNGVFTSPDDTVSVVTQANGRLSAFDTFTGNELWSFTPPSNNGLPTNCQGGVAFSTDGSTEYLVYSVIDNADGIIPYTYV